MKKVLYFLVIIIGLALIAGAGFGGWYYQKGKYDTKNNDVLARIDTAQGEIETLKATKDEKNYTPTDVVKNYLAAFEADTMDVAKLYFASTLTAEPAKLMKISANYDKLTITDTTQTISGDTATVQTSGVYPDQNTAYSKTFTLVKENGLWKINQIN